MEDKCNDKKSVMNRLSRLEGQVRGVCKMVEEEQDCEKILVQLSAVHAALEVVTKQVLIHFLEECMAKSFGDDQKNEEALKQKLVDLLMKTRF